MTDDIPQGLPNEESVSRALHYLARTDEPYARAVAQKEASEARWKISRELAFLASEGTVAERQASAATSASAVQAMERYEEAVVQLELLKAKRKRAELVIDVWRSLEASRRRA
jgi:hypothetical protein